MAIDPIVDRSSPHTKAVGPPLSKPAPRVTPIPSQEERIVIPKATAGFKVINLYRAIKSCKRHMRRSKTTYVQPFPHGSCVQLILRRRPWVTALRASANRQLNCLVLSHVENNKDMRDEMGDENFGSSYKPPAEAKGDMCLWWNALSQGMTQSASKLAVHGLV